MKTPFVFFIEFILISLLAVCAYSAGIFAEKQRATRVFNEISGTMPQFNCMKTYEECLWEKRQAQED